MCRGMQKLAVWLGAEIAQHLPDVLNNDSHLPPVVHRGGTTSGPIPTAGCPWFIGDRVNVATYHHQAAFAMPDRLRAAGCAYGGAIDAFELCDKTWVIGVPWHRGIDVGAELCRTLVAQTCRKAPP